MTEIPRLTSLGVNFRPAAPITLRESVLATRTQTGFHSSTYASAGHILRRSDVGPGIPRTLKIVAGLDVLDSVLAFGERHDVVVRRCVMETMKWMKSWDDSRGLFICCWSTLLNETVHMD
jgi:hypothetical protein